MSAAEHIVIDHLVMPRGSSLRIDDGAGILVRVRWGGAWLTQEADGRDHYLSAGEGFRLDRGGAALVTALRRACVDVIAPEAQGYARRIMLWPAGGTEHIHLHPQSGGQLVTRLLSAIGLAHA
jgi:hypothetical protein